MGVPGPHACHLFRFSAATPLQSAPRDPFLAEWRGTKGTVYVYLDGWEVVPERQAAIPDPGGSPLDGNQDRRAAHRNSFEPVMEARQTEGRADSRFHVRNFLDCVKSRDTPNCDVETAHRATTTANVANIAYKLRQQPCAGTGRANGSLTAQRQTATSTTNTGVHGGLG